MLGSIFVLLMTFATPPNQKLLGALEDKGFMVTEPGTKRIRWEPEDLPIVILVDPSAKDWNIAVIKAVVCWNARLGFDAFRIDDVTHVEAKAFENNGPGIAPVIGFKPDKGCPRTEANCNPHTGVQALTLTGRIVGAPVYVPIWPELSHNPNAWYGMIHELGHVLGLDHDEQHRAGQVAWSIMEPVFDLTTKHPPPITEADIQRITRWYLHHQELD